MSQTKEKAPGTAAAVTSAGKEYPQPKDTTMSTESKEADRQIMKIFERLNDREKRVTIAFIEALADEWEAAQK